MAATDSSMASDAPDASWIEKLIPSTLSRLTEGLPMLELEQMISEATDCEVALERDIQLLEKALRSPQSLTDQEKTTVDRILNIEFTPADRYFTISSLIGRLREPLALDLSPNSTIAAARRSANEQGTQQPPNKKKKVASHSPGPSESSPGGGAATPDITSATTQQEPFERYKKLLALQSNPDYHRRHSDSTQLLAAWKRVSSHRTAVVFRRPVKPEEAPGYAERILFPTDLGLVRKMIIGGIIKSWADLHQRLNLICHNCVKFNGRESDYGIVTREFEEHVDHVMLSLVSSSRATPTVQAAAADSANATSTTSTAAETSEEPVSVAQES